MFVLKPAAKQQLDAHFNGKDSEPIRIYLASGCGGPRLALALDEKKPGDQIIDVEGYTFLMDEPLFEQARPVTLDFDQHMGFAVQSNMKFPENTGGGCSSCGCGGSCS